MKEREPYFDDPSIHADTVACHGVLRTRNFDLVICLNPIYEAEIAEMLHDLGMTATLVTALRRSDEHDSRPIAKPALKVSRRGTMPRL